MLGYLSKIVRFGLWVVLLLLATSLMAQAEKPQVRPYADQKLFRIGFSAGLSSHDLLLINNGIASSDGETWFTEVPNHSLGFNIGFITDFYLNGHLNLRILPSLYFGERTYQFREQSSGEEYTSTIRSNHANLPILLKFSSKRINNYRPYVLGGVFASSELGNVKNRAIRLKQIDYGIEFGIGCNFYLPMFTLCPELRFSIGLRNLVDKNRNDLTDTELLKYSDAVSAGRSRMISLVFNFE